MSSESESSVPSTPDSPWFGFEIEETDPVVKRVHAVWAKCKINLEDGAVVKRTKQCMLQMIEEMLEGYPGQTSPGLFFQGMANAILTSAESQLENVGMLEQAVEANGQNMRDVNEFIVFKDENAICNICARAVMDNALMAIFNALCVWLFHNYNEYQNLTDEQCTSYKTRYSRLKAILRTSGTVFPSKLWTFMRHTFVTGTWAASTITIDGEKQLQYLGQRVEDEVNFREDQKHQVTVARFLRVLDELLPRMYQERVALLHQQQANIDQKAQYKAEMASPDTLPDCSNELTILCAQLDNTIGVTDKQVCKIEADSYHALCGQNILERNSAVEVLLLNHSNACRELANKAAHLLDHSDWFDCVGQAIEMYNGPFALQLKELFVALRVERPENLATEHYPFIALEPSSPSARKRPAGDCEPSILYSALVPSDEPEPGPSGSSARPRRCSSRSTASKRPRGHA